MRKPLNTMSFLAPTNYSVEEISQEEFIAAVEVYRKNNATTQAKGAMAISMPKASSGQYSSLN